MNQPKRGFDAHAVDGTLHQADKRYAAIKTELNLQQDIWLTGPKGCCGPLIDAQRNGGTEPIGRVVIIGDDFSLHRAHDYLAVGDNLQARIRQALRNSLSSNTTSGTGIDVRDKQCIDAGKHRIREAVELSNTYPLSRIAKLNGSDSE